MGQGNSKNQKIDWINSFDPRLLGLASPKGTLFRFIPPVGPAELLLKQDDGFTTNWDGIAATIPDVYIVAANGQYPTIQSAIDAAYAAGSGTSGIFPTILIAPGVYVENLVFRPGQALIGYSTLVSIGAIQIQGQHTYSPPAGGDILNKIVNCQGLTFLDGAPGGNTVTISGVNEGFMSFQGCTFQKSSGTGHIVLCTMNNFILVAVQCNILSNQSVDPSFQSSSTVFVFQGNSDQSGTSAPSFNYIGNGSANVVGNNVLSSAPYCFRFGLAGSQAITYNNFVGTFDPAGIGMVVEAGVTLYCTMTTILATQYVFGGSGTVNGAMLAYGIGSAKDPALTFNLLPSDPS